MGSAPGGPPEPDDKGRRDGDTEPIPRAHAEEGPGFSHGADYSPGAGYSADAGYSDGTAFGSEAHATEEPRAYGSPGAAGVTYTRPTLTDEEAEELSRLGGPGVPAAPRRVLPLEDEPSSLVARYLFPTERYRGEWKRHYIHLTTPLLIGAGATFVLGYLAGYLAKQEVDGATTVAVVVWLAVMGWVAWKIGDWFFDRFILTNKRVMVVNGIITRRVAMMPLLRVTDMKYEQSPLGRMLNYGTFVLESAGQEQALREIKHLPNPNELYLRVVEEMYEPQAVEARLGRSAEEAASDDGA
ncbi:MAG TPA: PH domain-containing protein [Pilimelia sp.]|nr:PH domain-containing protein [Pilimelia sp.]